MFGKHKRLEAALRTNGRQAPAQVLSWRPTKMALTAGNDQSAQDVWRVYDVAVTVRPPDGVAFDAEFSARFGGTGRVPRIGSTITVLYDPGDHARVVLDSSQPQPYPPGGIYRDEADEAAMRQLQRSDLAAYGHEMRRRSEAMRRLRAANPQNPPSPG